MACEAQRAAIAAIQQKIDTLEKVISATGPADRAAAQAAAAPQLQALAKQAEAASAALQKCLAAQPGPKRVPGLQPREIQPGAPGIQGGTKQASAVSSTNSRPDV